MKLYGMSHIRSQPCSAYKRVWIRVQNIDWLIDTRPLQTRFHHTAPLVFHVLASVISGDSTELVPDGVICTFCFFGPSI